MPSSLRTLLTGRIAFILAACLVVVRGRSLEERIRDGECSVAAVESGGTFFASDKRIIVQEIGTEIFHIQYGTTFKVLTSGPAEEQYVLTQCGQEAPTDKEVDAAAQLPPGFVRKHFQVPLQSATSTATVHLGFLQHLGVADRVPLVDPNACESCWQKALGCNASIEDSYYGNATLRAEQLASVDAVFMSCRSPSDCHAQVNGVYVHSSFATPLQGAEYLKFFSTFFNKDPQANALFSELKDSYVAAGSGYSTTPVVAWLRSTATELVLYDRPYDAAMVAAAGGINVDAAAALVDVPGLVTSADGARYSVPLPSNETAAQDIVAQFTAALAGVDVVMDASFSHDLFLYNFQDFLDDWVLADTSSLNFVQNKMVLRYDGTVASPYQGYWRDDWFESRFSRCDWAVAGLARVLHKDTSKPFRFFRNLAIGEAPEVLTAETCARMLPVCEEGRAQVIPILGGGGGTAGNSWFIPTIIASITLIAVVVSVAWFFFRPADAAQVDVELPLQQDS